jgi:hypothetical protein
MGLSFITNVLKGRYNVFVFWTFQEKDFSMRIIITLSALVFLSIVSLLLSLEIARWFML